MLPAALLAPPRSTHLVVLVQAQLVEHAARQKQAGAVGGGVVAQADLQAVAGQLVAAGQAARAAREGQGVGRGGAERQGRAEGRAANTQQWWALAASQGVAMHDTKAH